MIDRPQAQPFRPERAILALGETMYDPVEAAVFPNTILRFRNDRAAASVGLDTLSDDEWIAHFGRFEPLPGSLEQPLALRYHGHQFRVYNPEIGDGRGFLFAQIRDRRGRLMDLGTKGSGQTPWSRFGDGRLTLKGGVREILATEMLEALGVETSRSFSLIETGEALTRGDEPSPTRSSVLVRLSHGHIRIGSFQRLAYHRDEEAMKRLVAYSLKYYFGEEAGDDGPVRLLAHVVRGAARLAASYMIAGLVHGVLNSDNINITAESFDYGPWRFTPRFDPGFTAAYFDHQGLYAFGRQAEAIQWDVVQLAASLRLIADTEALIPALEPFGATYREALVEKMLWRLGVKPRGERDDIALVQAIETALIEGNVEIDRFFFDWAGGELRTAPLPLAGGAGGGPVKAGADVDRPTPDPASGRSGPRPDLNDAGHRSPEARKREGSYDTESFAPFRQAIAAYEPARSLDHPYWSSPAPCSMHIDEVEAIWDRIAEADDWSALESKIAAIRAMGEALAA